MKETFIIRTEWAESIFELSEQDQATIFRNLFHYHAGNENLINLNNLQVKLVWKLLEPNLKRNIDAYDKRKDTSVENGKLGGRPRNQNKPKKPNKTLSVSDSVSVSVSDNVNDNVNEPAVVSVSDESKILFESFRKKYPGVKRGLETEYKTFQKHKDWKDALTNLDSAITSQIEIYNRKKSKGEFVPEWPMLATWINQRRWEIVTQPQPTKEPETGEFAPRRYFTGHDYQNAL